VPPDVSKGSTYSAREAYNLTKMLVSVLYIQRTRVTRRVSHAEQELATLLEYLRSPSILVGFVFLYF